MNSTETAASRAVFWREWLPEILFLLVTTAAGLWAAGRWMDPTGDPGIWWSLPARISAGEQYYRDLYLQYGPLSPYLMAAVGRPFGYSGTFVLLACWTSAIAAGLLLLRVAALVLGLAERLTASLLLTFAAILAPGVARLVYPYCVAAVHALAFAFGALLLLGWAFRGGGRAHPILAGAFAGLAYGAKQEVGVAAALALASPLLTRGFAGARWVALCAAGATPLVGAALIFAVASAPVEVLSDFCHLPPFAAEVPAAWSHVFTVASGLAGTNSTGPILDSARTLLILASVVSLGSLLLVREKMPSRWILTAAALTMALVYEIPRGLQFSSGVGPAALSTPIAFLVALHAWLSRRLPDRELLIGLGVLAGVLSTRTLFAGDLSGPYSGFAHFAAALTWCIFLFRTLPSVLPAGDAAAFARRGWIAIVVVWSIGLGWRGLESLRTREAVAVETPHGRVWVRPRFADAFRLLSRSLRPGERVLVLPETHAIDLLYRVRDASPLLIHLPGWLDARAEALLLSRFAKAPPSAIVIFTRPTAEFGVRPLGRGYGRKLLAWVETRYRVSEETADMQIWRLRDVMPASPEAPSSDSPTAASRE